MTGEGGDVKKEREKRGCVRVCISVSSVYKERFDQGSRKLGISKSELFRRALDMYLASHGLLE